MQIPHHNGELKKIITTSVEQKYNNTNNYGSKSNHSPRLKRAFIRRDLQNKKNATITPA